MYNINKKIDELTDKNSKKQEFPFLHIRADSIIFYFLLLPSYMTKINI